VRSICCNYGVEQRRRQVSVMDESRHSAACRGTEHSVEGHPSVGDPIGASRCVKLAGVAGRNKSDIRGSGAGPRCASLPMQRKSSPIVGGGSASWYRARSRAVDAAGVRPGRRPVGSGGRRPPFGTRGQSGCGDFWRERVLRALLGLASQVFDLALR
jgi:hypothetical protein